MTFNTCYLSIGKSFTHKVVILFILFVLAVDNLDFTGKIVKKKLGEKLGKMLEFCPHWILGPKFDFSNSVSRECPFGMHAQQFSLMCRLRVFSNFVAMVFLIKSYSKPSKPKKTQNVWNIEFSRQKLPCHFRNTCQRSHIF